MLLINIVQLGERDVLHMVDKVTGFGTARFIRKGVGSATAKAMFNAFKSA